jgi:threonine/homoserine/homoserine lactone efflux protein
MSANLKVVVCSSIGNIVGLFLLSAVSILGLCAMLATSSTLFLVVKIFGAGYLIYVGANRFRAGKAKSLDLSDKASVPLRPNFSYF